jgi:hypothetical protein
MRSTVGNCRPRPPRPTRGGRRRGRCCGIGWIWHDARSPDSHTRCAVYRLHPLTHTEVGSVSKRTWRRDGALIGTIWAQAYTKWWLWCTQVARLGEAKNALAVQVEARHGGTQPSAMVTRPHEGTQRDRRLQVARQQVRDYEV